MYIRLLPSKKSGSGWIYTGYSVWLREWSGYRLSSMSAYKEFAVELCLLFPCTASSKFVILQGPKSLAVVINSIYLNLRIWILSDCHVSYILQFCPLAVTQHLKVALHDRERGPELNYSYTDCTLFWDWLFSFFSSPVSLTMYRYTERRNKMFADIIGNQTV